MTFDMPQHIESDSCENYIVINKTQMVNKSNFDNKQYKADLQSAYDCGFVKGAIAELEKIKEDIEEYMIISFCEDDDIKNIRTILDKHISELKGENKMTDEEKLDLLGRGINIGTRWSKKDTITELENIKDDIKEMRSKQNCSCSDCLDIIDKHIAELKGE